MLMYKAINENKSNMNMKNSGDFHCDRIICTLHYDHNNPKLHINGT